MKVSIENADFGREMLLRLRELEKKSGKRLGRNQKILLAEIGTVEQVLSILVGSPIHVRIRKQRVHGDRMMIEREVLLAREGSKEILIRAVTKIRPKGLPGAVVDDIRSQKLGIGSIISKHRLETFRRIVEVGYDPRRKMVYRIYDISYKRKPRFRIREEIYGSIGGSRFR